MIQRGSRAMIAGLAVLVAVSAMLAATPSSAFAIIGGSAVVQNGVNPYPAVVKIVSAVKGRVGNTITSETCSGTLISPTWVLTAQHCTNIDEVQGKPYSPSQVTITFPRGPNNNTRFDRTPAEIVRMPNYATDPGGDDVALLRLGTAVTNVAPLPLLDGQAYPSVGQVQKFGYGQVVTGGGAQTDARISVEGVRPTASLALSTTRCPHAPYGCWFPDNSLWTYDERRGISAEGDSGGPAIIRLTTGQYAVIGVTMGDVTSAQSTTGEWIGLSNRVDTASRAWNFIRSLVNDVRVVRPAYPDGSLVKESSSVWVYVVYGGARFRIPDPQAFTALGYSWSAIRTVPDGSLAGVPQVPQDGTVLREFSNPTVYRIESGRRRAVALPEYTSRQLGYFLHYIPDGTLGQIPAA